MSKMKIGSKYVGDGENPYFIADIAANHDGQLDRAFMLIELAKEAGADAAKFQNFKASKIVSKKGFNSMRNQLSHQSSWNKTVYEVYEDASISEDWTQKLKLKCDEVGIEYMTSPYDFGAVDLVNPFVNAFKIGSGDITWVEILDYIASKNKPVLLATGASSIVDVQRAVKTIQNKNNKIVLMQCNTNYTASIENFKYINLNVLKSYAELFPNIVLGLSDHTLGYSTVLGAIALGAKVIEKHFTDDNNRIGPDHKFSMNPVAWREMVDKSMELHLALGDGIKRTENNEKETSILQRRALYLTRNVDKGNILVSEDLYPVRPIKVDGIPPYEIINVIGKEINKDLKADDYLRWEDLIE